MKTVNLVTILLVLMLSVSCSGDSQQQYLREQIATKNGLKEVDISSLKYVHLLQYLRDDGNSAVVIVDSSCSFCVASFVKFAKQVRNTNIPLVVLIGKGHSDFVAFFVEQEDKELLDNIEFVVYDRVYKGNIENSSGDVYLFNQDYKAINYFNYETIN